MLTRFVRIQLAIFTIVGIIGVVVMVFGYIQAPTLLGIGRMTVTLELPDTGGLYRFSNVTYRGVQVGKVTAVTLTPHGAKATLSLDTSPKIPADLQADVRSISAVGEQYVDLRPRTDSPPYLHNGSVIAVHDTTIPQPVGPLLDKTSALVNSIPKGKLSAFARRVVQGIQRGRLRFRIAVRLVSTNLRRPQRRRRPRAHPHRGHRAVAGLASTNHRRDPAVGAQPRRIHRPVGDRRPTAAHPAGHRARRLNEASRLLDTSQTDVAGPAGQPHHPRPDLCDLPRFAGASFGVAAAVRGRYSVVQSAEEPGRIVPRRFHTHRQRPAGMHGRIPAALAMAFPGRHSRSSTPRTGCTANCRRIHRSRFAARATIPACGIPANARRQSRSATATSHSNHSRCGSTYSAPIRWIRTCSRRASRPMTGSTSSATGSSDQWRERRCRPGWRRRDRRQHHQDPRYRRLPTCRRSRLTFRPSLRSTYPHQPTLHHHSRKRPAAPMADVRRPPQVPSVTMNLDPVRRWPSFITTRKPAGMLVPTGTFISSRTSSRGRSLKRGRTCSAPEALRRVPINQA